MAQAKDITGVDIDRLEADFEADHGNFVPLARAYMDRNLPVQAIRVCKLGISKSPTAKDGRLALAMALYHNFEDGKAEGELKKAISADPKAFVAHRALGEIYLDRSQDQKAISQFLKAIEIEPGDPFTRELLKSIDEKVSAAKNGQPENNWLPRSTHLNNTPPRPLWIGISQVLVVALIMGGIFIWYQHHVEILVQVRAALKTASVLTPRDNFDDLLKAEQEHKKALVLDDSNEKTLVRQSFVQALLFLDHNQKDRLENLKKTQAWMDEEELPYPERFALKAIVMLEENKPKDADDFLQKTIKRAINKKDIYLSDMIFGIQGRAKVAQGKLKEARGDFSRAAKFSGGSPHYMSMFADVYLREGNYARAIRYFRDALRINPDHVFTNLRMAYAYVQRNKGLDKAKKVLDDLMDPEKHPEDTFSAPQKSLLYLVRAEYALLQKDEGPPKAAEFLRESLAAWDGSAEAHNLAGRLAAMNKDGAKAKASFAKALELDPQMPKVHFDRAESLFVMGEQQDAIAKLKEYEKYLKPTVTYFAKKGDLLMRMDDLDNAMIEFKKGVELDELSAEARFHVARCYQGMGNKLAGDKEQEAKMRDFYNQARTEYENSMMLPGGERAEVYHYMGLIYLSAENYGNALDSMGKAVMHMGKSGEPHEKIAVIYDDIAKVFKELGGSEGEKQEKAYLAKAQGLREGKTVDEVEKEWIEKEKAEKKSRRKRRRRRRR
ncbi:MAG: tetratricopeptide repeat protein [Deltaproteobacteria bacterium]|nr:tetratricopeptide repeat protein [Deltaproteobacteria bacterium]